LYNEKIRAARYGTTDDLNYAFRGDKLVSVSNNAVYSNGETFNLGYAYLMHEFTFSTLDKNMDNILHTALLYKQGKQLILILPELKAPSFHGAEFINAYQEGLVKIEFAIKKLLIVDIPSKGLFFFDKAVIIATYGYAISCHKAQGQEWDNVFIDGQWLMSSWDSARWYYTAITRGKKKVQVVENKYLKEAS
jgi:hypothetical protein